LQNPDPDVSQDGPEPFSDDEEAEAVSFLQTDVETVEASDDSEDEESAEPAEDASDHEETEEELQESSTRDEAEEHAEEDHSAALSFLSTEVLLNHFHDGDASDDEETSAGEDSEAEEASGDDETEASGDDETDEDASDDSEDEEPARETSVDKKTEEGASDEDGRVSFLETKEERIKRLVEKHSTMDDDEAAGDDEPTEGEILDQEEDVMEDATFGESITEHAADQEAKYETDVEKEPVQDMSDLVKDDEDDEDDDKDDTSVPVDDDDVLVDDLAGVKSLEAEPVELHLSEDEPVKAKGAEAGTVEDWLAQADTHVQNAGM